MSERGDLVVQDLHVQYGPAKALLGISLEVESGSVVAVLGPNGAGKSTLARAVSGLVPVTSGSVTFAGADITGRPAHRIRRAGLTYLPEGRGIFPGLTVMDNLRMATRRLNRGDRIAARELAIDLFPILGHRRRQRAGTLSGGEQQMLALARALAVHPTLIIADELSLGLAPIVADQVFEGLDHAREVGITIILIRAIHSPSARAGGPLRDSEPGQGQLERPVQRGERRGARALPRGGGGPRAPAHR